MLRVILFSFLILFSANSFAQDSAYQGRLAEQLTRSVEFYREGKVYHLAGEVYIQDLEELSRSEADALFRAIYFGRFTHNRMTYDVSEINWEIKLGLDRPNFGDQFNTDELDREVFDIFKVLNDSDTKNISLFISRKKPQVFSTVDSFLRKVQYESKKEPTTTKALVVIPPKTCVNLFGSSKPSNYSYR